jgi:hypothetical protein
MKTVFRRLLILTSVIVSLQAHAKVACESPVSDLVKMGDPQACPQFQGRYGKCRLVAGDPGVAEGIKTLNFEISTAQVAGYPIYSMKILTPNAANSALSFLANASCNYQIFDGAAAIGFVYQSKSYCQSGRLVNEAYYPESRMDSFDLSVTTVLEANSKKHLVITTTNHKLGQSVQKSECEKIK